MQSGATNAGAFELLNIIAEWLFSNKLDDIFRLPKLNVQDLQLQRLHHNYSY